MTLAEMLSTAHPGASQLKGLRWWREQEMPALPMVNGVAPSAQETVRLVGRVLLDDEAAALVPSPWRDPLACLGLQCEPRELSAMSMRLAERLGGPQTFRKLCELLAGAGDGELPGSFALTLLEVGGAAAVPILAKEESRAFFEREYMFAHAVREFPQRLGLSPEVWKILWEKDARKTLAEFQRRDVALSPAEIRALADHPAHSSAVGGLVWAVRNSQDEFLRAFVLPDELTLVPGEAMVIARASMLGATERAAWTTRLQARPPFDQWAFAEKMLDLTKVAADPLTLFTHLEARGWQRGPALEGVIRTHTKAFPEAGVQAVLEYTGVPVGFGGAWTRQRLTKCRFEPRESAMAASAVAEDLEELAA